MVAQQPAPPILLKSFPNPHVVCLALNRPFSRNAFNTALYDAVSTSLETYGFSHRVIVLHGGSSSTFSAGMDLKEAASPRRAEQHAAAKRFMLAFINCPALVIVAVHGKCIGIGTTMLLHADVVYSTDDASFSTPFTALGIVPEFASSLLFPRRLGPSMTAKLLYGVAHVSAPALRAAGMLEPDTCKTSSIALERAVDRARSVAVLTDDEWTAVMAAKRLIRGREREEILRAVEDEFEEIDAAYKSGRPGRLIERRIRVLGSTRACM